MPVTPNGNVKIRGCESTRKECRAEVDAAIGRQTPWRTYAIMWGVLVLLVLGCYAFVHASNGSVAGELGKVKVEIGKLQENMRHLETASKKQGVKIDATHDAVIRMEKNGGPK